MFSHAALNATLNGTSAVLLAAGYAAIRSGKIALHKKFMVSAFFVSCAFLVSYLVYHYRVGHVALPGPRLDSSRLFRPAHLPHHPRHRHRSHDHRHPPPRLAPERFDKHRLIARWTLPLWFYVSVTGVIVYFMVYQVYAPR